MTWKDGGTGKGSGSNRVNTKKYGEQLDKVKKTKDFDGNRPVYKDKRTGRETTVY